jgi:hypothetical protein
MNPNSFVPHRPNLADAEIEDQIRQRAYELCQERGGVDGNATDDWLRAKEEVLSSKGKGASSRPTKTKAPPALGVTGRSGKRNEAIGVPQYRNSGTVNVER